MELPAPLTSRVYLLAYNTDKHKLTCNGYLGYVLRAAALTELHHAGALSDVDGKVRLGRAHVKDPLLADVLHEIGNKHKPKTWAHWVHHAQTPMFRAVQQRLTEERLISTERYRILGIIPATRVKVLEHRAVTQLRSVVSRALSGGSSEPHDGALTALAAVGEVRIAISRAQARERKQRIDTFVTQAGPALPALRKVMRDYHSSNSAG
ncbi:GOLPH3/VPS74 family protein [Catelliglobosispora koreensis]|uniref:GOLPH3/VPS74 family protein n=1 Tax=Catelliglobosispora koreensis TaxID=129052 RepID=UPI00036ECB63|nr:GPP34 family phosphoprotein [Catelliglobosispora koreensis]